MCLGLLFSEELLVDSRIFDEGLVVSKFVKWSYVSRARSGNLSVQDLQSVAYFQLHPAFT